MPNLVSKRVPLLRGAGPSVHVQLRVPQNGWFDREKQLGKGQIGQRGAFSISIISIYLQFYLHHVHVLEDNHRMLRPRKFTISQQIFQLVWGILSDDRW